MVFNIWKYHFTIPHEVVPFSFRFIISKYSDEWIFFLSCCSCWDSVSLLLKLSCELWTANYNRPLQSSLYFLLLIVDCRRRHHIIFIIFLVSTSFDFIPPFPIWNCLFSHARIRLFLAFPDRWFLLLCVLCVLCILRNIFTYDWQYVSLCWVCVWWVCRVVVVVVHIIYNNNRIVRIICNSVVLFFFFFFFLFFVFLFNFNIPFHFVCLLFRCFRNMKRWTLFTCCRSRRLLCLSQCFFFVHFVFDSDQFQFEVCDTLCLHLMFVCVCVCEWWFVLYAKRRVNQLW